MSKRDPLSKVAAERQAADLAARKKRLEEANAIRAAREERVTWVVIGERMRMTQGQARWLATKVFDLNEPDPATGRIKLPRTGPRTGRGPGISVTEASRRLNVTRATIYSWCASGRLKCTENDLGHIRVLLEDELDISQ